MKKTLAISGLSLALILTACGQKDNQNQKVQKPINTSPKIEESSPSLNEESADKEGVSREEVRKLMTQSDYISRVKLTQLGDGQTELTILDNYKGSLSNIEFTEPKNLSTNKEYLIFYKDDADGNVVATSKDAVIEVASKNDTVLDYIERTYAKTDQTEDQSSRKTEEKKRDSSEESKKESSSKSSKDSKESTSSEEDSKSKKSTSSESKSKESTKTSSKSTTDEE
ncbi:conserved domain protein [Peptoniphilus sp. oral taxon 375 str. F0436]|nr:conserved domain protein [Peptoniphilus sp. oral taxon 375 str. F0436]